MPKNANIFISVAEHSADMHAARLVRTIHERHPDWRFAGLAGPKLREVGVDCVYDFTAHAAMLSGIFKLINKKRQALAAAEASWRQNRPDLVIVCDSSMLHLTMAKRAKAHGLPVLYYITPQTWASRPWRNRKIKKYVDKAACILPFEADFLKKSGIDAEFVGHPLFETLKAEPVDQNRMSALRSSGKPVVAMLPGSRMGVIDKIFPKQLDVIRRLQEAGHDITPAVSCFSSDRREMLERHLADCGVDAEILMGENASLLSAADLVLVASGTATLHVGYYRKPMIVMYDAGTLFYCLRFIRRLLINLPHLSLVNILAGAGVVPEFMPFVRDTKPIAEVAGQLLVDQDWRRLMVSQIDEQVRPMEESRASERVCELVDQMISAK